MKTILTTEESKHLIDLGVPKVKATEVIFNPNNDDYDFVFSLTDLLNGKILPKEIMLDKEHGLDFGWDFYAKKWFARYSDEDSLCVYEEAQYLANELIDALYQLTCWYYGEYLKSKKK